LVFQYRAKKESGPRTNEQITASEVRVISSTGEQLGIISLREALNRAEDEGYDLVEVSPDAKPPVCKIIDYGKLKYKEQKSKKEAKKKQKTIEIKEIKMRPGIDIHDYQVKVKALSKFIGGGNKVKVSMRFRGREMEHQNLGFALLKKLTAEVAEYAKVEVSPKGEGKQIMMILVPQIEK
jgi:translation initiation factor IF-3